MKFVKHIPNLLTLGNLVMGFLAIVCFSDASYNLLNYDPQAGDYTVRFFSNSLIQGTYFIALASVFDLLDGLAARVLKAHSNLGKQLDSLCDLVSFGLAPGLLFFQLLKYSWANNFSSTEIPIMLILPTVLIPCAAAYRLAKFNVNQPLDKAPPYFSGLPVPAAGLAFIAVPWAYITIQPIQSFFYNPFVLYGVIAFFSFLMISNRPMHKLDFNLATHKKTKLLFVIVLSSITICGFFVVGYLVLLVSVLVYILLSFIIYGKEKHATETR